MSFFNTYEELYQYESFFSNVFDTLNIDDRSDLMSVSRSFNKLFLNIDHIKITQLRIALNVISKFFQSHPDKITIIEDAAKSIFPCRSLIEIETQCISVVSSLSSCFLVLSITEKKILKDLLPNNYIKTIYITSTHMFDLDRSFEGKFKGGLQCIFLSKDHQVPWDKMVQVLSEINSTDCDSLQYYQAIQECDMLVYDFHKRMGATLLIRRLSYKLISGA